MSRVRHELEPRVAASRAFDALWEAGRYTGYGLNTVGRRLSRRGAAVGSEGIRRTGGAWTAMRGVSLSPPHRGRGTVVIAVTVGGTVGAAFALAVQRGVVGWRAGEPGTRFTERLRGAWRPAEPAPAADASATRESEALSA